MTERLLVLLLAAAIGGLFYGGFTVYRRRAAPAPERLDLAALDLELMEGCCAFIVFTSPSCRPCKAALNVVEAAARPSNGMTQVRTVDSTMQPEVALQAGVRTVPTVFLITASGHVVRRWTSIPDPTDVNATLARL